MKECSSLQYSVENLHRRIVALRSGLEQLAKFQHGGTRSMAKQMLRDDDGLAQLDENSLYLCD